MANVIYGNTEDDGSVVNTEYNATYSILRADDLNRPTALHVEPSRLIGRKSTGGVVSVSATDIRDIIGISSGSSYFYTVHPTDGIADYQRIQEAINEVPDGAMIILLNATYDLSLEATIENYASGLYISGKSLGIYGENRNKVVIVGVAEHAVMTINDYNNNNYVIKNITILPDIEDYYYAVKVGGNLTLNVEDNNIYSHDNVNSIYIGYDATVPINSNITISNNKFKNLDSSSESVSNGIYSTLHNNLNINNNIFNNYMEESVKVYYSKNVSINSNLIDGFVKTGIVCYECTNINIDNNKLTQSTALYSDNGFNALPIYSYISENVIISNNIIDVNSNVRINATDYVATHYTYWYKGIASYDNKNITINNNIISLNLSEYKGIVTGVWSNTDSRGIKITNNTININCTIVEDNSKQGIHLYDVTNALVSNNIIDMNNSATTEYGVYLNATSDGNMVVNNMILNTLDGKDVYEA